jgi:hypothetical protein
VNNHSNDTDHWNDDLVVFPAITEVLFSSGLPAA